MLPTSAEIRACGKHSAISALAKASGEPVFITNRGEDDGVFVSMAAFEERDKMNQHRDKIYATEAGRLCGGTGYIQKALLYAISWSISPRPRGTSRK